MTRPALVRQFTVTVCFSFREKNVAQKLDSTTRFGTLFHRHFQEGQERKKTNKKESRLQAIPSQHDKKELGGCLIFGSFAGCLELVDVTALPAGGWALCAPGWCSELEPPCPSSTEEEQANKHTRRCRKGNQVKIKTASRPCPAHLIFLTSPDDETMAMF